jgi:hypothetical protein
MPDEMGFGSEMFYPYNNAMFYGAAMNETQLLQEQKEF